MVPGARPGRRSRTWHRPPLLESGTYAVDPEHRWADGPEGTVLLAPGDLRGTALIPERLEGYCYGIDGRAGPNLGCLSCGLPVGSRIDDRGQWQAVVLMPPAVVMLPAPPERPVLSWAELTAEGGLRRGLSEYRDIPAGVTLAHAVSVRPGWPGHGRSAGRYTYWENLVEITPGDDTVLRSGDSGAGLIADADDGVFGVLSMSTDYTNGLQQRLVATRIPEDDSVQRRRGQRMFPRPPSPSVWRPGERSCSCRSPEGRPTACVADAVAAVPWRSLKGDRPASPVARRRSWAPSRAPPPLLPAAARRKGRR
jgi:hypothetical protein